MSKDSRLERDMEIFRMRYQHIVVKMKDYESLGNDEILITLNDGRQLIYNIIVDRLRWTNDGCDNKDFISEEEWRRAFSIRLGSELRMRCMTLERLSELSGISCVSLSRYLNGKATPSMYNAERIANVLGCSVADFRRA